MSRPPSNVVRHPASDALRAGRAAVARGAWADGRDLLSTVVAAQEDPEALEDLAIATFWGHDLVGAIELRERAYRAYLDRGDRRSAARVAISLALDCEHYLGETAVASGWKERATRLLQDLEPCSEHAWLTLWRAHHAILFHNEVGKGRALLEEAASMARRVGNDEVDLMARGLEGLALVGEGRLEDGMRFLDEAATAALAGELRDPEARGNACCYVLTACEQVLDLVRAAQWQRRVKDAFERKAETLGLTFCRRHCVQLLLWSGEWAEAEAEIGRLVAETPAEMGVLVAEARVLLAEVRRRQGRHAEARAILDQDAPHDRFLLGIAAIELDLGRPAAALGFADRHLRQLGEPLRTDHVPGLWLTVGAACAVGDADRASAAAAALESVAAALGTELMLALAAAARGRVSQLRGETAAARQELEQALVLFSRSRAPFEAAQVRLELAAVLQALGDATGAELEVRAALASFERLGAEHEAARARRALEQATATAGGAPADAGPGGAATGGEATPLPLSDRELEVLRLVAQGLSNAEVAERLFLSAHTVKRHVANILGKLDLPTRAAAAALAVRRGLT